jgi:hydroxyethylthiazole kinase-like uncharacterized protein yjeF
MKILSADQIYKADEISIKNQQTTSTELMERAGSLIAQWLDERLQNSQIVLHIFCGIGNNGGDGLVVGRLLLKKGYNVNVYIVNYSDKRSKDFLINYDRFKNVTKNWPVLLKSEKNFPEIKDEDIVIDAIFGIGLNRSPEGWVKNLIEYLNSISALKVAIDIPSGLLANEAVKDMDSILKADHTLTFQVPKLSFFLPETADFVSAFDILDIGLDTKFIEDAKPIAELITKLEAQEIYRPRKKFEHKGTYGHTLIVGGSYGKIGAAVLSTSAAFRIGAGMVSAFVPKCGYNILQTAVSEAMVITDKEEKYLSEFKLDFEPDAVAIGMGIGQNIATAEFLKNFLKTIKAPLVIDADALNLLAKNKELLQLIPKSSILTPHPGELKRLIGSWTDDYDKIKKAKKFSKKHNVVLIIKGAYSMIIFENKVHINTSGNPGMATAGSGDTLSGVISGLLSQGYDPLSASIFGVFMHGSAGDIAASQMGYESVMARDIIKNISEAYLNLFTSPEQDLEEEYEEDF